MKKINRLIKEAKLSCEMRDHKMTRFSHTYGKERQCATAICIWCNMNVAVCAYPWPNQIEIYVGSAVSLNCPGEHNEKIY
jgi:uncharacterized Fe-S cluster-containing radical SAM superfamily protein